MSLESLSNSEIEEKRKENQGDHEDLIICVIAPFDNLTKVRQLLLDNEIEPLRKSDGSRPRDAGEHILMRTNLRGGKGWPRDKVLSSTDSSKILSFNGFDFQDSPLTVILKSTYMLKTRARSKLPSSIRLGAQAWLDRQSQSLFEGIENDIDAYCNLLPLKHTKYSNLLLLPQYTFESSMWQSLLERLDTNARQELYREIAKAMRVTHIAINASIPGEVVAGGVKTTNILRSPSNIIPLYGSFGPVVMVDPTTEDFDSCFWVDYSQNGISQHWCPLYTMFSRGNITEKTRLLGLSTLCPPKLDPAKSTAVDLYAGIGYFAFCYKAKGFQTVLCWDLNPWSLNGMKKGAIANGWSIEVIKPMGGEQLLAGDSPIQNIVAFEEDNECALRRIQSFRHRMPSVRHINCGLLPTSSKSWRTAIRALDPELGGWIHAHENIDTNKIDNRRKEIVELMRALAETEAHELGRTSRHVICESANFVKSFAPRKDHIVFDIWTSGMGHP